MKVHINHDRILELKELDEDGSSQVLKSLITLFLSKIPLQIEQLSKAFEDRDYVGMKAIAHSICGSGLDLGAETLSSISHRIEHHATAESDLPALAEDIAHLKIYFKTVKSLYSDLNKSLNDVPGN